MLRLRISVLLIFVPGLLFLGTAPTLWAQITASPISVNFGNAAVGTPSASQTVTFTFGSSTTLGGVAVVTQGAANNDYTVVAAGTTCGAGVFSTSCTVEMQFLPLAPGSRWGALVLSDSNGNALSTTPLFGIGTGPMVAFAPGIMSTVVGGDVAGATIGLNYPNGVGVDAAGNVYVGDTGHDAVRKLSSSGVTTTIAGGNGQGYSGDGGPATSAQLYYPTTIRLDGAGNIYIVDDGNNAVRMINSAGNISTVAGLAPGASVCAQATDQWGDGCPATQASLDFFDSYYGEGGTATDAAGNLYIGDTAHNLIRMVSAATGIISIFAGTGAQGYSGDGGPATSAQLNNPDGGVFDGAGNFYFSDLYNNVIRMITPGGTISTVAGTGAYGHTGDGGLATSAELGYPYQVAVDAAGDLYITDSGNFTEGDKNEVIREVNAATGIINTVAGTNPSPTPPPYNISYSGDGGPASSALMWGPVDIVVDGKGNFYIADDYNHAIRKVDVSDAPTVTLNTPFSSVSTQDVAIENLGNTTLTVNSISSISQTGTDFAFSGNTCASTNQSLAAAASCIVGIQFTAPASLGPYTGSVAVGDDTLNVSDSSQTIALQGISILHPPMLTWATPAPITYPMLLSGRQLNASASYNGKRVSGKFTYSPPLDTKLTAGVHTLQVSFAPEYTNIFSSATAAVILQVNRATPTIVWGAKTITYPTPLGPGQLDATTVGDLAGTFMYTPGTGTVLGAGSQLVSVTFTPSDTTDYVAASKTDTITVDQGTPVITWATPRPITVDTPLSATQLDAVANAPRMPNVPGTYVYTFAGNVIVAGDDLPLGRDTLTVTFTPDDTTDFKTGATRSVVITVEQ